ncbi:MAG: YggT family protein, partial [Limnohabitans sp.]
MIYEMASLLLDVIAGLVAGTCLLRLAMQAQRIPFNHPLGRFVFALTDWIVMPLRKVVPYWSRWDLSSLVAAWLIKALQFLLLWLLDGSQGELALLPLVSLVGLLQLMVSALSTLVLVYALMSWLQPGTYFFQITHCTILTNSKYAQSHTFLYSSVDRRGRLVEDRHNTCGFRSLVQIIQRNFTRVLVLLFFLFCFVLFCL